VDKMTHRLVNRRTEIKWNIHYYRDIKLYRNTLEAKHPGHTLHVNIDSPRFIAHTDSDPPYWRSECCVYCMTCDDVVFGFTIKDREHPLWFAETQSG
jgi:hypothetical protein